MIRREDIDFEVRTVADSTIVKATHCFGSERIVRAGETAEQVVRFMTDSAIRYVYGEIEDAIAELEATLRLSQLTPGERETVSRCLELIERTTKGVHK